MKRIVVSYLNDTVKIKGPTCDCRLTYIKNGRTLTWIKTEFCYKHSKHRGKAMTRVNDIASSMLNSLVIVGDKR